MEALPPRDVTRSEATPTHRPLTDRETEILHLLPGPMSRKDMAVELNLSENTVKAHLTAISRKLGVSGRAAIVERATELGLLDPQR